MNCDKLIFDVAVIGGGMGGLCAAIASARNGANTILIQDRPVLGGNASSEIRMHITGALGNEGKPNRRETGIIEEILLENKYRNPDHSYAIFDSILWEKARFQENLTLYLNTYMTDVEMRENHIVKIFARQLTTEKKLEISADIFVDATGDGTLSYLAGAEFMYGREEKSHFLEEYAVGKADTLTMGNSIQFHAIDMGHPVRFERPEWAYDYSDAEWVKKFSWMNVNAQVASYPSKIIESFLSKYYAVEQEGRPVNFKDDHRARVMKYIYEDLGIDMYSLWIDCLNEIGVNPWLSFRTNDCHKNWIRDNILVGKDCRTRKDLYRVTHREPDPSIELTDDDFYYWDKCFDYAIPEVREKMLALIEEALDRYGVYGIELDFTRELPAFKLGYEAQGRAIMTQFVADVRKLLGKFEERRNKEIKLQVMVGADPQVVYNFGYDVTEWAKQGLIDSVVAISRWETIYNETPVRFWKQLLSPYKVEFAAGNQILTCETPDKKPGTPATLETDMGAIAVFRSQGADFTYLYNRMDHSGYQFGEKWFADETRNETVIEPHNLKQLFAIGGTPEKVINSNRRHLVTFYDFPNAWDKRISKLPFVCEDSRYCEIVRIMTGAVPEDAVVKIMLGVESEKELSNEDFNIIVNAKKCTLSEIYAKDETGKYFAYTFDVPSGIEYFDYAIAEISCMSIPFTVTHIEIDISCKKA